MALLSVKNLTLAYEAAPVVKDLSFDVSRGDNLVIVGENGSGKSTLMRALMGLKAPESGRILLGDGLTQRKIGYLPQQSAHAQDFPASVRGCALRDACKRRAVVLPARRSEQNAAGACPAGHRRP